MTSVIVESVFDVPISDEELASMARRADPCLEVRNSAWVRTSLSKDRKRMICEFAAPDAESVRQALRSADHAFERTWTADVFSVEMYPEHLEKLRRLREAEAGAVAATGATD